MPEEIRTRHVKGGYSTTDDVVLATTATTRTVFRPALTDHGVRGCLIRQKLGLDGRWAEINEVDFRKMPADAGVMVELDTTATSKLFEHLTQLYEVNRLRPRSQDAAFVVGPKDEVVVIGDRSKSETIRALVNEGHSEEFWRLLREHNGDLATRLAASAIELDRREAIERLAQSIDSRSDDEAFWQDFFEGQPWMLQAAFSAAVVYLGGETYLGGKRATGRGGGGGVATDFLFADESTMSFAVVEIKTPGEPLVGGVYRGKRDSDDANETYSCSPALSGAVIQTQNQIAVAVEHFKSVLGPTFDELNRVHPKGVLILGRSSSLSARQKASFNQFRYALHGLTVLTYDELLLRLRRLYAPEM